MFYMSDDDLINEDLDDDENVNLIPQKTLHRIDKAFDDAVKSSLATFDTSAQTPERSSRQSLHPGADPTPGGFILEDEPGGFIIEADENDPQDNAERPQFIPLSMIPTALQLLDLQPDDPDVLEVFRNAASGWGAGTSQEQRVSRKDWRAVCGVLTGNDIEDNDSSINTSSQADYEQNMVSDEVNGDDDNSEEDEEEGGEINTDASDEYLPSPKKSTSRKKLSAHKRRRKSPSMSSNEEATKVLSTRQRLECRKAFALFFPDTSESDSHLENKKIMIKDITRVANLLKEKLIAEDIIEMVEAFSSSKDKSVTLADFERIMITAKLA